MIPMQFFLILKANSERAVQYDRETGARCPNAKLVQHDDVRVSCYWSPGGGVRYHRCPQCGQNFKSIEHSEAVQTQIQVTTTEAVIVSHLSRDGESMTLQAKPVETPKKVVKRRKKK